MKIKKHTLHYFVLGIITGMIIALICGVLLSFNYSYNIHSALPQKIICVRDGRYYNGGEKGINSTILGYLNAPEKIPYWGKVNDSNFIMIITRNTAYISIYPYDKNSVIVEYDPLYPGFTERYKISTANYNEFLQIFYEYTGDEIFNETLDYLD